jgi:succinate dehydrogenase / fumarate reductase, cytochrome b subunit
VKTKRPVNLDISTIQLPLAAITSITHRISGVVIFVGLAGLLWILDSSLSDESGFAAVSNLLTSGLSKFLLWGVLTALGYHTVAGCKHLLLDMGVGESKEAAPLGAKLTLVISGLLAVLLGVWLW